MTFPILTSPHVILACAKTYTDVFVFICESAKVFHDLFKEGVATAGSLKCWEIVIYLRLLYFGTKLVIRIRKTIRLPCNSQDPLAFVRPEDFNENHIKEGRGSRCGFIKTR